MESIKNFNDKFKRKQLVTSIIAFGSLGFGICCTLPLFDLNRKYAEIEYCVPNKEGICTTTKRGIDFIVSREINNNLNFRENIEFLRRNEPENKYSVLLSLLGTTAMLSSLVLFNYTTRAKLIAFNRVFTLIKAEAIENQQIMKFSTAIKEVSLKAESDVAQKIIENDKNQKLNDYTSDTEKQYQIINAIKQAEIDKRLHTLSTLEIDAEVAKKQLEIKELELKLKNKDKSPTELKSEKDKFIALLKSHEDGWLHKIVLEIRKPLWLVGNQGSGKTTTATTIGLIRKYVLDAPVEYLIDRHAQSENADKWNLLSPSKLVHTDEDIHSAFIEIMDMWITRSAQKPTGYTQIIVDEFTHLIKLMEKFGTASKFLNAAMNFFSRSLSDCRKPKSLLIGITHNHTNDAFGEKTDSLRKAGMILMEKFSANNETPLNRVVVHYGLVDPLGNNLIDLERTIPDWFVPDKIEAYFNGDYTALPVNIKE
jgi:hypothetical protein